MAGTLRWVAASALAVVIGVTTRAPAAAAAPDGSPRLYLSWSAPYGTPRAARSFVPTCDDTSARDTLYLSFELPKGRPPVDTAQFVVEFHPAPGDTLMSFWFFRSGWPNRGNMWIDLVPYAPIPAPTVWPGNTALPGEYDISYDHRSGTGRLVVNYAVPSPATPLDPGVRYNLARVRILHRRLGLGGCNQPVCVEWTQARLHFITGRDLVFPATGERFVGWNAKCPEPGSDP